MFSLATTKAGLLFETLADIVGIFLSLWIVYTVRELILDILTPAVKDSDICTTLPDTYQVRDPRKKSCCVSLI
ncbi:hypothetical protein NEDG_01680 [Nematocida displodere]|uniref:Uncharacterized protein n=1 Tax=Nematocida displodere TaxID=1805483 RepID=A0A177EDT0_9MICR|nr:hypothetical protein NEDG_01680 [Nematocida displodere]